MNSSNPTRSLRVFLVENHADTLCSLTLFLRDLGHVVHSATTVSEAQSTLSAEKCDVLICDIGLPDGTGWELMEKIKDRKPAYAIAMSGFGMNADTARSRVAGFRHHFVKPFKTVELERVLEQAAVELARV